MKRTDPFAFRRGDLLWIDCDPSVGAEPRKVRTCVVVSNDIANRHAATLSVVPTLSYSAPRAARPYYVDLRPPRSTMQSARVANASAITSYDKSRVVAPAGKVSVDAMAALDRAVLVHLGINPP